MFPKLQTALNADVSNRLRKLYRGGDASLRCEAPGCFPVLSVEWGTVLVSIHRNCPKFHGNIKREGRSSLEEDHISIL